ncbi:MAG: hypothetical protein KJ880_07815, partial [Candidatus Omnitrophica bacterium]|nr:hypothetical protein [Candidatus Omnitrophota bacterium]
TGLGLSSCYTAVKNSDGDIEVASTQNKGSTFFLRFKPAITHETRAVAPAMPRLGGREVMKTWRIAGRALGKKLNVLIIDDDQTVMDVISDLFKLWDAPFSTAANMREVRWALEKNPEGFNVIVSDYLIGQGNRGTEVLLEAVSDGLIDPRCFIIIVTASASAAKEEHHMKRAIDELDAALLSKPFIIQDLAELIVRRFSEPKEHHNLEESCFYKFESIRRFRHWLGSNYVGVKVLNSRLSREHELAISIERRWRRILRISEGLNRILPAVDKGYSPDIKLLLPQETVTEQAVTKLLVMRDQYAGLISEISKLEASITEGPKLSKECFTALKAANEAMARIDGLLSRLRTRIESDYAKPRPGYSPEQVVAEATQIIQSGQVESFARWDENHSYVQAAFRYYELTAQAEKAKRLRDAIAAGHLRAGPLESAFGANALGYILIAINDNLNPAAVIIHENNGASHQENLAEEERFLSNKEEARIKKDRLEMREAMDRALKGGWRVSNIIQTAFTTAQAQMYSSQIDWGIYPPRTYVKALADPKPIDGSKPLGRAFGNGLANLGIIRRTLQELVVYHNLAPGEYGLREFLGSRFLVGIHGGGASARNPKYTQIGKFNGILPIERICRGNDQKPRPTTLQEELLIPAAVFSEIFPYNSPAYFNIYGDATTTFDSQELRAFINSRSDIADGMIILLRRRGFQEAPLWGCAAVDSEGRIVSFAEKPTKPGKGQPEISEEERKDLLNKNNLLVEDRFILMNTAFSILGAGAIAKWGRLAGLDISEEGKMRVVGQGKIGVTSDNTYERILLFGGELDTFGHLVPPMAQDADPFVYIFAEALKNLDASCPLVAKIYDFRNAYIKGKEVDAGLAKELDSLIAFEADNKTKVLLGRASIFYLIWQEFHLSANASGAVAWGAQIEGEWLDTGRTSEELDIILRYGNQNKRMARIFEMRPRINSVGGSRAYYSVIQAAAKEEIDAESIQIQARLVGQSINLRHNSQVYLVDWNGNISLCEDAVMTEGTVFDTEGNPWVIFPVWGKDNSPKESINHFGADLKNWLATQLKPEELALIWPQGCRQALINARIFPGISDGVINSASAYDAIDIELYNAMPDIWEWLQRHLHSPPEAWLKALRVGRLFSLDDVYNNPASQLFRERRGRVREVIERMFDHREEIERLAEGLKLPVIDMLEWHSQSERLVDVFISVSAEERGVIKLIVELCCIDDPGSNLYKSADYVRLRIRDIERQSLDAIAGDEVDNSCDYAKPRQGFTTDDVITEVAQIITSGQIDSFESWTLDHPVVKEALRYYDLTAQADKARRLRDMVSAGHLRAGPLESAFGANVFCYIFIATNDNLNPAAVIIHENNNKTHIENLKAEHDYFVYLAKRLEIYAHRGAQDNYAKENTLQAFQDAIDLGCDGAELDTQITADNRMVVYRLKDLNGKAINEYTLDEIKQIDPEIPSLEEVLRLVNGRLNLDIHLVWAEGENKQAARKLVAEILALGVSEWVTCASIFTADLDNITQEAERLGAVVTTRTTEVTFGFVPGKTIVGPDEKLDKFLAALKRGGCDRAMFYLELLTPEIISKVHAQGMKVSAVGRAMSAKEVSALINLGVDEVMLFNPKTAKEAQRAFDQAKPREGYSAEEVAAEAVEIISSGKINNTELWAKLDENHPWVKRVISYYERTGELDKAKRLRSIVNAGHLRMGPLTGAFGANVVIENENWILIASNDNRFPVEALIHEANGGTHEENLAAEIAFKNDFSVLVSGGAGLVASFCVRRLLEKGYKVVIFDNLTQGNRQ